MGWTRFVDMELTDEEKIDTSGPAIAGSSGPDYPYGLRICLDERSLAKLKKAGLEGLPEVGDYVDVRCFACVSSVSEETVNGESRCRVELQIEKMALENENDEEGPKGY